MKILKNKLRNIKVNAKKSHSILISFMSLITLCSLAIIASIVLAPQNSPKDKRLEVTNMDLTATENSVAHNLDVDQKLVKIKDYEKNLRSKHKALVHVLSSIKALDAIDYESFAIGGEENGEEDLATHLEQGADLIKGLPLGTPLEGEISSNYGYRTSPFTKKRTMHTGIDIKMRERSQIQSTADGIVSFAGVKGGYGNVVEIEHKENLKTLYAHLSEIKVKKGQKVCREQVIGLVGSTGRSTGPHLHYEVKKFGFHQNPKNFIDAANLLKLAVDS